MDLYCWLRLVGFMLIAFVRLFSCELVIWSIVFGYLL